MSVTIHHGDCRETIATLPDCSVDSIVTDPPYELGFMGKRWDASGIAYDTDLWREALRVLKPGGHLLAFGGTRTYHRMTVAIEDAGFEIRDSIHWLYGSGFPKSLDVSKAIDKQRYARADVYRITAWIRAARDGAGITNRDIDNAFGFAGMAGHWTSAKSQPAVPTLEQVPTLLDVLGVALDDVPDEIRRLLWKLNGRKGQPGENWAKREVVGKHSAPAKSIYTQAAVSLSPDVDITAPATDAARTWEGWGTALKPAHEPIVVARKPLVDTVAANVLEHGTGALNIDGTRVGRKSDEPPSRWTITGSAAGKKRAMSGPNYERAPKPDNAAGRWPANLTLTHAVDCADGCSPSCPVAALDGQSGPVGSWSGSPSRSDGTIASHNYIGGDGVHSSGKTWEKRSGGASRFFTVTEWDDVTPFLYTAKPSRRERDAGLGAMPDAEVHRLGAGLGEGVDPSAPAVNKNIHPTVKPLALMRWLVRLVTPPGGTVLEPFAGSGTTLAAAILEGFNAIGCELTDDYLPIIEGRVAWAQQEYAKAHDNLFGDAA